MNIKNKIAIRLATRIADTMHYSSNMPADTAEELFDVLSDLLVVLPDDQLLRLYEGLHCDVECKLPEVSKHGRDYGSGTEVQTEEQFRDDFGTTD